MNTSPPATAGTSRSRRVRRLLLLSGVAGALVAVALAVLTTQRDDSASSRRAVETTSSVAGAPEAAVNNVATNAEADTIAGADTSPSSDEPAPTPTQPAPSEYGAVAVTGSSLGPLGDPATDSAIGTDAPQLAGTSFGGVPISVTPGKATLLMFVAHWCPPCQRVVPQVTTWAKSGGVPGDVRLVAIATGTDGSRPNYPPSEWLAKEALPAEILRDDQEMTAGQAYGLNAFPFFVAVGADGKVRARASGEITREQIDSLVAAATSAPRLAGNS